MILRRIFILLLCFCISIPAYGAKQSPCVALTFDDGPSGRFTRALLDGLERRQVKATFLLCGYRLKDYPKEARRIQAEGHEIGLHGYSHSCMADMCQEELERELADTLALLPEGAVRILMTADLELIESRFAQRMRGVLPPPVQAMLERKHGIFDQEKFDYHIHNGENADAVCAVLSE